MKANISVKVSFHEGRSLSYEHNLRSYLDNPSHEKWNDDGHINHELSDKNIILESHDIKDMFYEIFSEPIAEYNKKNERKHPDRVKTIEQYYDEKILGKQKDGTKTQGEVREDIIQAGNAESFKQLVGTIGRERAEQYYVDFYKDVVDLWRKDNPNLKIVMAVIHLDESVPHMHLDYLPVSEEKRGLKRKVTFDGAVKDRYARKEKWHDLSRWEQWQGDMRTTLEATAGKYFETVVPHEHTGKKHMRTDIYRAEQKIKIAEELEKQRKQEIEELTKKELEQIRKESELQQREADIEYTAQEIQQTYNMVMDREQELINIGNQIISQKNQAKAMFEEAQQMKDQTADEAQAIINQAQSDAQQILSQARADLTADEYRKDSVEFFRNHPEPPQPPQEPTGILPNKKRYQEQTEQYQTDMMKWNTGQQIVTDMQKLKSMYKQKQEQLEAEYRKKDQYVTQQMQVLQQANEKNIQSRERQKIRERQLAERERSIDETVESRVQAELEMRIALNREYNEILQKKAELTALLNGQESNSLMQTYHAEEQHRALNKAERSVQHGNDNIRNH